VLDDEFDRGLSCVDDVREWDDEFRDVAEPLSDEENVKRRNEDDFDDEAGDGDIFWLLLASSIVIRRLNGTRRGIATSAREMIGKRHSTREQSRSRQLDTKQTDTMAYRRDFKTKGALSDILVTRRVVDRCLPSISVPSRR
jgi:hypothetical protein